MSRRRRSAERQEYAEKLRNVDKIRVLEREAEVARLSKSRMVMNIQSLKETNDSLEEQATRLHAKCLRLSALLGLACALALIFGIAVFAKEEV